MSVNSTTKIGDLMIRQAILAGSLSIIPVAQCAPPTPQTVQCNGGVYSRNISPQAYTAICSTGQGWVEIDYQCRTHLNASWYVTMEKKQYRPDSTVTSYISAYCPPEYPFIGTVVVSTYQ